MPKGTEAAKNPCACARGRGGGRAASKAPCVQWPQMARPPEALNMALRARLDANRRVNIRRGAHSYRQPSMCACGHANAIIRRAAPHGPIKLQAPSARAGGCRYERQPGAAAGCGRALARTGKRGAQIAAGHRRQNTQALKHGQSTGQDQRKPWGRQIPGLATQMERPVDLSLLSLAAAPVCG